MKQTFVISLGGSLIIPKGIDVPFLRQFKQLVSARVSKGDRFVIITGGGSICRTYLNAARAFGITQPAVLDSIGIEATKLNAYFVRSLFGSLAHPSIITTYQRFPKVTKPIVIGAGWKPGRSTDYDAVMAAVHMNASTVINCSDISHVYTRDPDQYPDAKKLTELNWTSYLKIVGPYTPGGSYPFDPVAARLAKSRRVFVVICNGRKIANLKALLSGKPFQGTTLHP